MNNFSYRWRLWELQRWWDSTSRSYDKLYREAEKSGDREDLERIRYEERTDLESIEDKITHLETRYLLEQARRLLLATPEFKPKEKGGVWIEWKTNPAKYYLAPEGIAELRTSIRKERRESRESAIVWLAAGIGVVGALTGLVSVIMK